MSFTGSYTEGEPFFLSQSCGVADVEAVAMHDSFDVLATIRYCEYTYINN